MRLDWQPGKPAARQRRTGRAQEYSRSAAPASVADRVATCNQIVIVIPWHTSSESNELRDDKSPFVGPRTRRSQLRAQAIQIKM
jgi:hypothetical protein